MQEYLLQRAPLRPHRTTGQVSTAPDAQRKALGLAAGLVPPPKNPSKRSYARRR